MGYEVGRWSSSRFSHGVGNELLRINDYADQRYFTSLSGRFLSSDPYEASGGAAEPGSWNRYPYVGGDPVNFGDPSGLKKWWISVSMDRCTWSGSGNGGTLKCATSNVGFIFDDGSGGPTGSGPAESGSGIGESLDLGQRRSVFNQTRRMLQGMVDSGDINDCAALAYFGDVAASLDLDNRSFVAAFGAITNSNWISGPLATIAGLSVTNGDVRLNRTKQTSGFAPGYQNSGNESPTADQAHHFAAFFQLGYLAGGLEGSIAADLYDSWTGNPGDRALGRFAANLGHRLKFGGRDGSFTQHNVMEAIRNELCRK